MRTRLVWGACLILFLGVPLARAAAPPPGPLPAPTAAEIQSLADRIDRLIAERWDRTRVQPAPVADDAEFLRRVYLDLAGRIPSVAEARAFLDDRRPNKRPLLIKTLLDGPRHVAHFTNVWRALLIPEAGNNFQVRLGQGIFENWLKQRIARNTSYDRLVRELLTVPTDRDRGFPFSSTGAGSPVTFYLAKEYKPENLAGATARVFLGVSVECAQCHHHPFASWKKEQFWGFAAFFAGIKSQRAQDFLLPDREDLEKRELLIPGTDKTVQARFLDGGQPRWRPRTSARYTLADWITSPTNPYFARAAVNRTWAYFLGTGLVEPVDEMVGTGSTPSHPELLDLLATEFTARRFDLKFLVRVLLTTRTYQRSSLADSSSAHDATLFTHMPVRGLTPEQLFDSLAQATGYRDSGGGDDFFSGVVGGKRSARSQFLTRFALSERPREAQTAILQALTLMNGKVMEAVTSLEKSETLAAVVDAPFVSKTERIETLYLATLSRKPSAKEVDRAMRFIDEALVRQKSKDEQARQLTFRQALADLFWALLNSPDFVLEH